MRYSTTAEFQLMFKKKTLSRQDSPFLYEIWYFYLLTAT